MMSATDRPTAHAAYALEIVRTLDAPPKLEEAPASQLTHVFLSQSRKRRDDAQRAIGPLEDRAFRRRVIDGRIDQLEEVVQRPPGIRRKAIADH